MEKLVERWAGEEWGGEVDEEMYCLAVVVFFWGTKHLSCSHSTSIEVTLWTPSHIPWHVCGSYQHSNQQRLFVRSFVRLTRLGKNLLIVFAWKVIKMIFIFLFGWLKGWMIAGWLLGHVRVFAELERYDKVGNLVKTIKVFSGFPLSKIWRRWQNFPFTCPDYTCLLI